MRSGGSQTDRYYNAYSENVTPVDVEKPLDGPRRLFSPFFRSNRSFSQLPNHLSQTFAWLLNLGLSPRVGEVALLVKLLKGARYLQCLKDQRCTVIAMRDLARYVDPAVRPKEPYTVIRRRAEALKNQSAAWR